MTYDPTEGCEYCGTVDTTHNGGCPDAPAQLPYRNAVAEALSTATGRDSIGRWITDTCPECGDVIDADSPDGHLITVDSDDQVIVIMGCEWYPVIDPNAIGVPGTWEDWTAHTLWVCMTVVEQDGGHVSEMEVRPTVPVTVDTADTIQAWLEEHRTDWSTDPTATIRSIDSFETI